MNQPATLLTAKDLLSHPLIPFKSINTIKAHVERGNFPAPIDYGPRHKRWKQSDISDWLSERVGATGGLTPA